MNRRPRLSVLLILAALTACFGNTPKNAAAEYIAPDYANAGIDLTTPQGTAYAMMIAMYRGDANLVDEVFHEHGRLSRVKADGRVEPNGLKRWRDWVGTLETGQAYEELFSLSTEEYGKLATVWAPFIISFDDKIVGCGVNQLSMAKDGERWRIISAMDTPAPKGSCDSFKADYLAAQNSLK